MEIPFNRNENGGDTVIRTIKNQPEKSNKKPFKIKAQTLKQIRRKALKKNFEKQNSNFN
jgi:hypothetical protein